MLRFSVHVSLTQLIRTMHNICKVWGSNPEHQKKKCCVSTHLFLHCNHFGSLWKHIFQWLGVSLVSPFDVAGHFNLLSFIGGAAKPRRSILQVIWYATVGNIERKKQQSFYCKRKHNYAGGG